MINILFYIIFLLSVIKFTYSSGSLNTENEGTCINKNISYTLDDFTNNILN